jgi:hypothetical protein
MAKLDPRENDVVRLGESERAAFVRAVQPVLDRHRRRLAPTLFAYLGA